MGEASECRFKGAGWGWGMRVNADLRVRAGDAGMRANADLRVRVGDVGVRVNADLRVRARDGPSRPAGLQRGFFVKTGLE